MDASPHSLSTILFTHDGEISPARGEEMLGIVQGLADKGDIPRAAFRVFVELEQNIRLHGGAKGNLTLSRHGEFVVVQSRNAAPESAAQAVLKTVEDANHHAEDLAAIMRAIRARPLAEGAQGAGLGLYEIRRHSCRDVEAVMIPANDGNSELVITVTLKHKSTL